MNIIMPPEVRGEPYFCEVEALAVPDMPTQYTTFFRGDTGIGEVLGLAADEPRDKDQPLRVISAGCSYGAEVDTVLALAHKHDLGTIAITGVDGNSEALEMAQLARYRISPSISAAMADYASQGADLLKTMQAYGIDVRVHDMEVHGPALRTERLRQANQVAWRLGDLAVGELASQPADLILCNNVIYHYRQETATADAIARNLARNTAQGGIVSFGANLVYASMDGWARDHATPLLAEEGLVPVVSDNPNLVAFQRVR